MLMVRVYHRILMFWMIFFYNYFYWNKEKLSVHCLIFGLKGKMIKHFLKIKELNERTNSEEKKLKELNETQYTRYTRHKRSNNNYVSIKGSEIVLPVEDTLWRSSIEKFLFLKNATTTSPLTTNQRKKSRVMKLKIIQKNFSWYNF